MIIIMEPKVQTNLNVNVIHEILIRCNKSYAYIDLLSILICCTCYLYSVPSDYVYLDNA